jgi:hypothetical protein
VGFDKNGMSISQYSAERTCQEQIYNEGTKNLQLGCACHDRGLRHGISVEYVVVVGS